MDVGGVCHSAQHDGALQASQRPPGCQRCRPCTSAWNATRTTATRARCWPWPASCPPCVTHGCPASRSPNVPSPARCSCACSGLRSRPARKALPRQLAITHGSCASGAAQQLPSVILDLSALLAQPCRPPPAGPAAQHAQAPSQLPCCARGDVGALHAAKAAGVCVQWAPTARPRSMGQVCRVAGAHGRQQAALLRRAAPQQG